MGGQELAKNYRTSFTNDHLFSWFPCFGIVIEVHVITVSTAKRILERLRISFNFNFGGRSYLITAV